MALKEKVQNAIDLLTGETAKKLNKKFQLVAGGAEPGYAKLMFKSNEMKHYEDGDKLVAQVTPYNGALIPEDADLKDLGLPSQILKAYDRAQDEKKALEAMGISDVKIGYTNASRVSSNGGKPMRLHALFIVFPIDKKHNRNHLIAKSMAKHDSEGVNYYKPVRQRMG
jgi:hypothetical protein